MPSLENNGESFVPSRGRNSADGQHLITKYGEREIVVATRVSRQTKWGSERCNICGRYIVSSRNGRRNRDIVVLQRITSLESESIVSVTGVGDTLSGPRASDEDLESLKAIVLEDAQAAVVVNV